MHFFLRTRDLLVNQKTMQSHLFTTLHPFSPVIFATATVVAFILLYNSRFNFHCYKLYTAWSNAYSEISPEVTLRPLSWLFARKITKGIHSRKPASLSPPNTVFNLCVPFSHTLSAAWTRCTTSDALFFQSKSALPLVCILTVSCPATPKSASLAWPSLLRRMLPALMSRWIFRREWRYSRPLSV